jgi:hypothetical protein
MGRPRVGGHRALEGDCVAHSASCNSVRTVYSVGMANPRFQKDGPKRRRRVRRETSNVSRQGWVGDNGPKHERARSERQARKDFS